MKVSIYTQMKNETNLVVPFINHYFNLGFNDIYIYDDQSTIPLTEILENNQYKSQIHIYNIDFSHDQYVNNNFSLSNFYDCDLYNKINKNRQEYLINFFIKKHKSELEWVFFCDADELLYINENNIHDYLEKYINKYTDMSGILFQWIMYGTSFHSYFPEKKDIYSNFTWSTNKLDSFGKVIVNINDVLSHHIHIAIVKKNIYIPDIENIDELITTNEYSNRFGINLNNDDTNRYINFNINSLNAFLAHYVTCDVRTFFHRKYVLLDVAFSIQRSKNYMCQIYCYNQQEVNYMLKYSKFNFEPQILQVLNFEKYNKENNTNFNDYYDLIKHFYLNKTNRVYFN
jgi:hypothetical protein